MTRERAKELAPKKRYMTSWEALLKCSITPGMVTRVIGGNMAIHLASVMDSNDDFSAWEYAVIDKNGPIDGWHKFETEEEA